MKPDFTMPSETDFPARLRALGYSEEAAGNCVRLVRKIKEMKAERRAIILAHSYERPEIHEAADAVGDSLELSRRAAHVEGEVIVFAGVRFMAETAKILSPGKTVLLPKPDAGCSLADSIDPKDLSARISELKSKHPDLSVVCYINSTAAVKALSDACCTSANAAEVVGAVDGRTVLFVPDRNLAAYVSGRTDKEVIPWNGSCHVHDEVTAEAVESAKREHPSAEILAHPECRPEVTMLADAVLSTSGMQSYAAASASKEFIIVTESGMADRLAMQLPGKIFHKMPMICPFMKTTHIEDVAESLERMRHEIEVPEKERAAAERAVRRMLELAPGGSSARAVSKE